MGVENSVTSTWEDKEALGQGWEELEASGDLDFNKLFTASGEIEQAIPYDLGTIFEFNILSDLRFENVSGGSLTLQISISEDGVSYTAFANVSASTNYRARYLKFKYILSTSNSNHNVYFHSGTIFVNAPTVKVDYGRNLLISASGSHVTFRGDFTAVPRVTSLNIVNGIKGRPYSNNVAISGMDIYVADKDDVLIGTARVDWEVKGS